MLDQSMAEEANKCFEMMTDFLLELEKHGNDSSLG